MSDYFPERGMERGMATDKHEPCTASFFSARAPQFALGAIVRREDCFAERTLDEGLLDDEVQSFLVRMRGQFP